MDQIFRDHLPFMLVGLTLGAALLAVPRQSKSARRASTSVVVVALLYPVGISLLYVIRSSLGEGYAYLIYGSLLGVIVAVLGIAAILIWILLTARAYRLRRISRLGER